MCLLEMISKEIPYTECANAAQIFKKVTNKIPPTVLSRIRDPSAREFIMLMLMPNPNDRPTVKDLLAHPFLAAKESDDCEPLVDTAINVIGEERIFPDEDDNNKDDGSNPPPTNIIPLTKVDSNVSATGSVGVGGGAGGGGGAKTSIEQQQPDKNIKSTPLPSPSEKTEEEPPSIPSSSTADPTASSTLSAPSPPPPPTANEPETTTKTTITTNSISASISTSSLDSSFSSLPDTDEIANKLRTPSADLIDEENENYELDSENKNDAVTLDEKHNSNPISSNPASSSSIAIPSSGSDENKTEEGRLSDEIDVSSTASTAANIYSNGNDGNGNGNNSNGNGNGNSTTPNTNTTPITPNNNNNSDPDTSPTPATLPPSPSSNSLGNDYNMLLNSMQESEAVMKKPKVLMGRGIEDDTSDTGGLLIANSATTVETGGEATHTHINIINGVANENSNLMRLAITFADQTEKVEFEYDLINDNPLEVAREMQHEFDVPASDVLEISHTISALVQEARAKQTAHFAMNQERKGKNEMGGGGKKVKPTAMTVLSAIVTSGEENIVVGGEGGIGEAIANSEAIANAAAEPQSSPANTNPVIDNNEVGLDLDLDLDLDSAKIDNTGSASFSMTGFFGTDSDVDSDDESYGEVKMLQQEYEKTMQRSNKAYETRLENLLKSKDEREMQYVKAIEKYKRDLADYEKRIKVAEVEQKKRLSELQEKWVEKKIEINNRKKNGNNSAEVEEGKEMEKEKVEMEGAEKEKEEGGVGGEEEGVGVGEEVKRKEEISFADHSDDPPPNE